MMSLAQLAKLPGRDPWDCFKDVRERLYARPNYRIDELLSHRQQAAD
jgi:hypothetical protein